MNIAIIGYGQMGKEIEKISISRNHKIGKIIDQNTKDKNIEGCDVAILFTTPKSAVENIKLCIDNNIPVLPRLVVSLTRGNASISVNLR